MRDASGGLYPAIAVWENVVGAMLSSDKRDYLAVLKSFAGTEVSMPDSGHWADAGMVRGRRCDLAWRVLDAQYWSKPKLAHRERIFVVADFTGQRAAEILFNTRSMHTDSRLCSASGLSAAEDRRDASFEAGRQIPVILPFYGFKMRGAAANRNRQHFIRSFGKRTDVFPTILASEQTAFAYYAKECGLTNLQVFSDCGYTGLKKDRPAYQKLLEAIRTDQVGDVIVYDLSRLNRDYENQCGILLEMKTHGVVLHSIREQRAGLISSAFSEYLEQKQKHS